MNNPFLNTSSKKMKIEHGGVFGGRIQRSRLFTKDESSPSKDEEAKTTRDKVGFSINPLEDKLNNSSGVEFKTSSSGVFGVPASGSGSTKMNFLGASASLNMFGGGSGLFGKKLEDEKSKNQSKGLMLSNMTSYLIVG